MTTDPTTAQSQNAQPASVGNIAVYLSPSNPNQSVAPAAFGSDLNGMMPVDKADIASIVSSRFESGVRTQINAAVKTESAAATRLNKARAAATACFDSFVLAAEVSPLQSIADAFNKVGFEAEVTPSGSYSTRTPTASWARKSDSGSTTSNPQSSIALTSRLYVNNNTFSLYRNFALPADLIAANTELDEATRLHKEAQDAVIALRQQLNGVASIERQARGAIAESALSETEAGRKILSRLDAIAPLPSLPEAKPVYLPNG